MKKEEKKKLFEAVFLDPKEVKRRGRVRDRNSYALWKRLHTELEGLSKEEVMIKIHGIVDERYGWHTATKSVWAWESLKLFLEDLKGAKDAKP